MLKERVFVVYVNDQVVFNSPIEGLPMNRCGQWEIS